MRVVIQRVSKASVSIAGEQISAIGPGYLLLLGVAPDDSEKTAELLWQKIRTLRILPDKRGKTNLSLLDTDGSVLLVSQFTLYANVIKGRRPSFVEAAPPDHARALYAYMIQLLEADLGSDKVQTGEFGANMQVSLINDGPFTIVIDSDDLATRR